MFKVSVDMSRLIFITFVFIRPPPCLEHMSIITRSDFVLFANYLDTESSLGVIDQFSLGIADGWCPFLCRVNLFVRT